MRRIGHLLVAAIAMVTCTGFGSGERLFAPSADLWPRWQAHDAGNRAVIDHSVWGGLLARYVVAGKDGVNRVDYRNLAAKDKKTLASYIASLAAVPISRYSRAEQLAYWINLYNALTVKVVVDHYPVETIRDIDISPGFFADGPWGKKLVTVGGEEISLNDIEHRILRPIWHDSRIHYAVNCASIGCPNLQREPYTADTTDAMLTRGAHDYINSPRGVSIRDGTVTVSKIYDWYYEDFGDSDGGVLRHLLSYAEPALRNRLRAIGKIDDVAYDWRLNGAGN